MVQFRAQRYAQPTNCIQSYTQKSSFIFQGTASLLGLSFLCYVCVYFKNFDTYLNKSCPSLRLHFSMYIIKKTVSSQYLCDIHNFIAVKVFPNFSVLKNTLKQHTSCKNIGNLGVHVKINTATLNVYQQMFERIQSYLKAL